MWKLLIDRDLNKAQLQEQSSISAATMAKIGKGRNVTAEAFARICETPEYDIADI
ncbi:helix-turn-helix domain-containing protein [Corynebacterium mastitidis]|uniref:helix-turn-helix domain-containing protein n=1 Tax=Corynebacterium mastitidis TaxID=161890 RepID=UPI00254D5264|nr:helix-turn-helix transcriptional regulator [Corynebacterium mastitidis]MDK8451476.1 helix-turn-helix transcriptional regulator [Corynebacterium mastitidis]